MLNNNPFSLLAELISPQAMQYFIIAMILLIAVGTIIQMIHHKNLIYFFNNVKKAKLSAEKELGTASQVLIIGLPALYNSFNLFFLIRKKFQNEYI